LGISRSSLFDLLKKKEIDSILVMGRRVIPHDSLVDYVNRLQRESATDLLPPVALEEEEAGDVCSPQPIRA
jgi:hypothetical protein